MRYRTTLALALAVGLAPSTRLEAQESPEAARQRHVEEQSGKVVELFDGKSLNGWGFHLVDPNAKLEDVWSVKDGAIHCKGTPFGYLHTKKTYQDFRFTLQWRWPSGAKPGNSGVLLGISGKPIGFMPKCIEAQLQHGSAGDIWAFHGFKIAGPQERFREVKSIPALGNFVGIGVAKHAEKAPGQWNTYEITFRGDKLSLAINGQEVNHATGCDVVAGQIGLQSEGGPIEFRKISIAPIE